MPIATLSDGVDVRGGQMNEVADREVGRKADGDQYFGTKNQRAKPSGGGSLTVGTNSGLVDVVRNSGLVDVARNSGSVDVGTNMLQGRLEVGYNGPSGIQPIQERRVHNQTIRTVGTAQETRGGTLFPGNGQRLGASVNPESGKKDGRVLLAAPSYGKGQVASAGPKADPHMKSYIPSAGKYIDGYQYTTTDIAGHWWILTVIVGCCWLLSIITAR